MKSRTLNLTKMMLKCRMRTKPKKKNKSMIHNEIEGAWEWLTSMVLKSVWVLQVL